MPSQSSLYYYIVYFGNIGTVGVDGKYVGY